jgi:hypothetical protein
LSSESEEAEDTDMVVTIEKVSESQNDYVEVQKRYPFVYLEMFKSVKLLQLGVFKLCCHVAVAMEF